MFYLQSILIAGIFIFSACSSADRADLSSDNLNEAITEVQNLRDTSRERQFDLLASDHFEKGEDYLADAKKAKVNDGDRANILKKLSQSKAHFIEAEKVSESREKVPERILTARKTALKSGVRDNHDLVQTLNDIDTSLRRGTSNFSSTLSVEKLSEFEQGYLMLEVKSVQNKELGVARNIIKSADKNNAPKRAPTTYRNATNNLRAAENMIQQSSRNPENYRASVIISNESAELLDNVMEKFSGVAKGGTEENALKLVYQERALGTLSDRATRLQGALDRSERDLDHKTDEALVSQRKNRIQEVMEEMRTTFTSDEADVYQQGDSLLIRLKKIGFGVGSAEVPRESEALLSKVNDTILKLDSSSVVVTGHTDSTGAPDFNRGLSVKRSESVANHLKTLGGQYKVSSEGYGESHPISSNQTQEGRALNRRVDIVINAGEKM